MEGLDGAWMGLGKGLERVWKGLLREFSATLREFVDILSITFLLRSSMCSVSRAQCSDKHVSSYGSVRPWRQSAFLINDECVTTCAMC